MGPARVSAQGGPELNLTKTAFKSEVESGEPFEYVFNYRCASINDDCEGAVITDPLPPEVEFVPDSLTSTSHIASYGYDSGTRTVTWVFKDPLPAGSTGILKFQVQFPSGTLPGTTTSNTATFSAANAVSVTTLPVDTTVTGVFEMYAEKAGGPAVIGFPATFDLKACSPDSQGGVRFTKPTFIDYLPDAATFNDAQGNQCSGNTPPGASDPECWVYDDTTSPRTVTWYNLPTIDVGGCFTRQITLQYNSDPGATQVNNMDVTGTPEGCEDPANLPAYCNGQTESTISDDQPFDVIPPYPEGVSGKTSDSASSFEGTEALPGEDATYVVSVENTGYEDLINVVVTDTIPAQLILQSFTIGPASAPGDAVNGFYQVDGSTWFPLPGNSYIITTTIDSSALDLHGGARITELKWEIGTLAIDGNWASIVIGKVDSSITPTYPPESFQNCTGFNSDNGVTSSACNAVSIIDERAIPRPAKSSNGKSVFPEEFVDFTVGLRNDVVAQLPFDNPMLVDLLPPEFDYVAGSANLISKPASASDPNFEVIPDYNGTGRTLLRWTWQNWTSADCDPSSIEGTCGVNASYSFQPGEDAEIAFTVQVKKGTPPGLVDNVATIVDWTGPTDPDDPPNSDPRKILLCEDPYKYVDTDDLDGDGNTFEESCLVTESTEVGVFLSMDSEKWVRGEIDCETYNDPAICDDLDVGGPDHPGDFNKLGLTIPGERVDYLIHTINNSNVPVTNISFLDITPYIGDTGVIDLSPRLSQWRPNLQSEVVDITGGGIPFTVFYSTAANPCRPEFAPSLASPPDCQEPHWTTTLPANPTAVQSIKVDFCTYNPDGSVDECLVLDPDSTLTFGWHMVAPNGAPTDASCLTPPDDSFDPDANPDCQIAWNSFGFKAVEFRDNDGDGQNDPDHLELLPSEPIKVGIRVAPLQQNTLGDYVWLDVAGIQNDGIQQDIEQQSPWGVNGVRVELWDADTDTFIDYKITGPDHNGNPGYYMFSDLPDGNYYLRFFPPPGYTVVPANQGGDDTRDSDGEIPGTDPTYGDYWQTADISLNGGVDDRDWDFGMYRPTDYSDAPFDNVTDFYPTSAQDLANAGLDSADAARHILRNDLRMGATVDDEIDGFPEVPAWGDDQDQSPDDEDGVAFDHYLGTPELPSVIMVIGETSSWEVTVTVPDNNRLGDAYLNAWLDFNGDGDWDDAGEQIATDMVAAQGTVDGVLTLNIPVPDTATPGTTHARFRLSYTQGLQPTGTVNYGEVEDYQAQLITKPEKSIVATSEAHTTDPDLTIGEIVRYKLTIPVPEGDLSNFQVTDHLPNGLQYLDDGTVSHTFISDDGMSSTEFTVSGGPFGDGTNPVFTLGTVTNPDRDNNEEFVEIEFNALVLNVSGNVAGDTRDNTFQVTYDTFDYTSEPVTINIVEPSVSIVKTVTTSPPIDAGDEVTYQLTLTNDGAASTAFDLAVDDILDANLDLTDANNVTWTAPAYATVTNNSDAANDEVHLLINKLEPGDQVTILITVTVRTSVSAGEIIPNVANLSYTSLPGPNGTDPNPTGSVTPGATGEADGERDYGPSDSEDIVIDSPKVDKLDPSPTDYTIGEDITYYIKVTLPEGTTRNLIVVDDLPFGLEYQSHQIITSAGASGGRLGDDFNGSFANDPPIVTAPGGSGGDASFNFGDTVTNADNNAGNNAFLIEIVARVLDTNENNNGDTKDNVGKVQYTNPNDGTTEEITDTVTVNIIEPFLNVTKEVVSQPDPVGPGGQVQYRVTIEHTTDSAMDAYDVVFTDTLPQSLTNVQVTGMSPSVLTWSYDPGTGILRVPDTGSFDIPLGTVYVINYTADITTAVDPGGSIENNADIGWTSMDGDYPNRERNYGDNDTTSIQADGEFGDLPDGPYPTLYANNGARHLIPSGSNPNFLGATVDAEPDGQPNVGATGDDDNPPAGPDDEDGVIFLTPVVASQPAEIEITANADGFLHGWMDFDADGTLDDILITHVDGVALGTPTPMRDYPVTAGTHTYRFTPPANTTSLNPVYSRFRFTSYDTTTDPPNDPPGQLGPGGLALDGEVEDYVLMSIGNRVWFDENGNGVQDAGEPPIADVLVNLLGPGGNPITDADGNPIITTTDGNGWYNFGGLPPGDYIVEVDASNWDAGNVFGAGGLYPDAYGSPGQGGDDHDNTDDNGDNDGAAAIGVGVRSVPINLSPGEEPENEDQQEIDAAYPNANSDLTLDFGFTLPVSVGSLVWRDTNANGIQDDGEPTIEGAVVTLLDSAGNTVTTDLNGNAITPVTTGANGIYHFTELPAGDYIIQVQPPAGMKPTPSQVAAPNNDDNTDSNIASEPNPGEYRSGVVTLTIGGEPTNEQFADGSPDQDGNRDDSGNMTVDFGFVQPVSLGSFVWVDVNRDGVQDVDEPPIEGATVTLLDDAGNPVTTDLDGNAINPVTTGPDGVYNFSNLPPGDYRVQVEPPAGYRPSPVQNPVPNDDDNTDSNIEDEPNPGVFISGPISLLGGAEPTGEVFADGTDDQDGNPDADGNMTLDFGFFKPVSLGSLVWLDLDANGLQDVGEPGIENATVTLLDSVGNPVTQDVDGNPIAPITTGADGVYHFVNLPPGDYMVEVQPPAGHIPTLPQVADPNTDDNTDSNIATEPSTGVYRSGIVSLAPGTEPTGEVFADGSPDQDGNPDADGNMTVDFGFIRPVSLGSLVWHDINGNGVQDDDESPIQGAIVSLVDSAGNPVNDVDGNPVADVTTDTDGVYHFTNLVPGDYKVQVTPPAGFSPSPIQQPDPNTDDNTDSNIADEPSSGVFESGVVTLVPGLEPTGEVFADGTDDQDGNPDNDGNMTVDFGFVQPVSVGSLLWKDLNSNGTQDVGEPGVENATVTLLDSAGNSVNDLDGNPVTDVTTGADGVYHFTNLAPGDYIVQVTPPADMLPTPIQVMDPNTDDNTDSNIASEPSSGVYQSGVVTLANGLEPTGEKFADGTDDQDGNPDVDGNMTVDFGFVQPVSVGSLVWLDQNANGAQDVGEPSVDGAVVTLLDSAGDPVTVDMDGNAINPVTTGTDGVYHFVNLPPGDYIVQVEPPAGFIPTPPQVADPNTDDNTDSNIASEPSSGVYRSGVVTLTPGDEPTGEIFANGDPDQDGNPDPDGNMTVDFGFIRPVSLGSFVWQDSGGNGVQDAGEPGIENANVHLMDSAGNPVNDVDGNPVADVTTGTDGVYHFTNLVPGVYMVEVTPPAGWTPTSPQVTDPNTDDNTDSNIATEPTPGTWRSDIITLSPGTEPIDEAFANGNPDQDGNPDIDGNMTLDFGFVQPVSLGSLVWFDENVNGVQDTNESPISGAVVTLLDSTGSPATDMDGNPVADVTTGVDGVYHFTNLPPGDYLVQVTPSGVYTPTSPQVTDPNTDDNTDSNIASETAPGVYQSGVVILSIGGEPTGEVFADGSADQDGNSDVSGNMTVDFGFVEAVSVGSLVWQDSNGNGLQDVGEPAIQGATVTLLDSTGNPVTQDITGNSVNPFTTGSDGVYHFTNLPAGDYIIQVEPPAGLSPSPVQQPDPNTDDNTDSNIASEPSSGVFQSGVVTLSVDGEPTGETFADGSADQDGNYDASGNMTVDFGFTPTSELGSLGDFVWWDINHDGLQDAGEPGIEGVSITLTDGVTLNTTTDANGIYTFTNLLSDTYTITIDASNFQPGGVLADWNASPAKVGGDDTIDSDGDETTHDYTVTLASGEDNPNIDFGFYPTSAYTLTKALNTTGDIRVGDPISFTISITNTGSTWLVTLPLTDDYDQTYLSYGWNGNYATPPSDDTNDDGQIDWADITDQVGDLAPGDSVDVIVWFTTLDDTSGESGGITMNTATAHNVMADPDGPSGPLPPDEPLDDLQGPTSDDQPIEILQPTGLFVTDFSAQVEGQDVTLAWETVSELNIAGFQVLRRRAMSDVFEPVGEFVSAQWSGMDQGGMYTLTDNNLGIGRYVYLLQVVTLDGRTMNAESIQVTVRNRAISIW